MQQVTLNFELTLDDFTDILDAAGYAIGYWADEAEPDGDTYTVSCEEATQIFTVSKRDIELAMASIAQNRIDVSADICHDVMLAIKEEDCSYIDGYAADAIIQVACFGEIVYG
jgi:hypothetical protein